MSERELLDAYLTGVESLRRAVCGLTREQLLAHPVPGTWSVLEVICHLADSEGLFTERMKRVLSEERPPLLFSDPVRQAASLAYDSRAADIEVELIALMRQQMSSILRHQPANAWQRVGVHSKEGERTLVQIVQKAVVHLEHHLEFIRQKRRALHVDS